MFIYIYVCIFLLLLFEEHLCHSNKMDNGKPNSTEKHVTINVPEQKTTFGNRNFKFTKVLSITEKYQRKLLPDDLIYSDDLLKAVSRNDIDECKRLVESDYDLPDKNDDYFFHPLLLAAKKGRFEIMKILLDNGANIDVQDKKNSTALHYAIQQRSSDCCHLLLEEGIDVSVEDKTGNLPLHVAATEGIFEIVQKLLDKVMIPNSKNKKDQTPLHLAAMKGNADILKLLLKNGGRWDLKDVSYWLPLHYAAFHGHYKCVDILIEAMGDKLDEFINSRNKDQATPLILAAKKGHSRCCQNLNKADIDAFDNRGNTALHLAATVGFSKTVEVLLDMKPNIRARNRDGNTPIHKASFQKNIDCLKLLVNYYGEDPGVNNSNQTVIHLAASLNCDQTLRYLLENPIFKNQLNAQDKDGKTALNSALNHGHSESSEVLIEGGIDCNICDNKGNIPLHIAAGGGMYNICRLLLSGERVQKVNFRNSVGTTSLHLAAMSGSVDCCKLLLTKGADLLAIDSNGFSPFHIASNEGNLDVIKLLTKKGGGCINQPVEISGDTPLHLAARKGFYDCCVFILKNMKKDLMIKLNNNEKSALDEAFIAEKDDIFYLILSKIPFPSINDKYNVEQYYPFQCSLHEYMHESLESNREIIQKAIIASKWWFSGFSSSFCEDGQCQNLLHLSKQAPKMAEMVYDNCIENNGSSTAFNFRIFESSYYSPLDPNQPSDGYLKRKCPFNPDTGKLNSDAVLFPKEMEHPLFAATEHELLDLLQHKLTSVYLDYKWRLYMRWILLLLLVFESIFVAVLGLYLSSSSNYDMMKQRNLTKSDFCLHLEQPTKIDESNETDQSISTKNNVDESWTKVVVLYALLIIMTIAMTITEIFFHLKVKRLFLSIVSSMRIYRLIAIMTFLVPVNTCSYDMVIKETWQWQLGIISLLVSWFHLMHTLNEIPALSVFMPVTTQFTKSFLRVLLYVILILFVFAFIFHLLLRENPAFEAIPVAFIKTTVWVLGDLSYDSTFLEKKSPIMYPALTNIIFLLLVTSISYFVVNTIIAQPTEHLELFRERAVYHKLSSRIRLFYKLDSVFDRIRKKYLVAFIVLENQQQSCQTLPDKNKKVSISRMENGKDVSEKEDENQNPSRVLKAIIERLERIELQLAEIAKK